MLLVAGTCARADDLTLTDDARLTGNVRSIDETGVVELASALSPEALRLNSGTVAKVEFGELAQESGIPGALVELTNGDLLPATIIGLDEKTLQVDTAAAGPLSISRTAINSLQLGVRKRRVIYTGPNNLGEWSSDGDGAKNWTFSNKSLAATGPAYASKNFDTPKQFILKFTLKWQINPNIQIYFADPLNPKSEANNRYCFQFNAAGLEIKRLGGKGPQGRTVLQLPRTADMYPDNLLSVEIHVDRSGSRIQLYLNGEPEGAGVDGVPDVPEGGGMTIINATPNGSRMEVRNIEIMELDNIRVRHRAEDRGDVKSDSLISRDDDRWGGHLATIEKKPEGNVFSFKSDFQEQALELLESDVSTVFFAHAERGNPPDVASPKVLRLRNEGSLRLTSCVFSADDVIAEHPLLGSLKMKRAGIEALVLDVPQPKEKPEE